MNHTKEPWKTGTNGAPLYWWSGQVIGSIEGDSEGVIATCNQNYSELSTSNARRIVACVNACAGIETEELELNVPVLDALDFLRAKLDRYAIALSRIGALSGLTERKIDDYGYIARDALRS